jgi:hypothetical protein
VAPIFALAGAAGGVVAALLIHGSPPPVINAVLWAIVGAITAFLVYASEGPRARPISVTQAAVADGVVTGIIGTVSAAILDLIVASGAGTSSGTAISAGSFLQTALLSGAGGLVGGAALGLATLPLAGRDRLERPRAETKVRSRPRKRNRKR